MITIKNNNKRLSILNLISFIVGVLLILITIGVIYLLKIINILPDKYLNLIILGASLITILLELILIPKFKKKFMKVIKIIVLIISCILLLGYSLGIYMLNKTLNLFDNIGLIKEEVTNYYIVVLKDSRYEEPSDIYNKKLAYYETIPEDIISSIKLDLEYIKVTNIDELKNKLFNKEVEAILISDIFRNKYVDEDNTFEDNIRILKNIEITNTIEDITKRVSMKNTPFNVLISGIDTYGDINTTSRNDVNIVATVNPNTNEILLTSIPRDYYVYLHGITKCKDKLTHASYYGTNMAVQTIEDIFDIDINYYIKVNFTTVVDLVDIIGGVEVYSDQNLNLHNCYIKKGTNNLNGKCALAFSRERHAYVDGDRHRGRNQQAVITAIFKKLSTDTNIITKYDDILKSLNGKFATNIDLNDATSYLKYELNDLNNYEIISIQVDGSGSSGPTYSYPGQDLWIMIPDEETISKAKEKMNKALNDESIK